MRIGIDARELTGRPTGVGRYLRGLLREWMAGGVRHEFVLYAPEAVRSEFDPKQVTTHVVAGRPGTWWEQVRLPAAAHADRLDVFFAPAYTAPLRLVVPLVVTIHDVSFVAHPEWFRVREGMRRRWLTRRAAAHARTIVTVSRFSRSEIIERLDVSPDRVVVIPSFVAAPARAPSGVESAEPRVLFVGSIFNRRHVPDLIRAFGRVARAHPSASLEIVGDNRTYPHQAIEQIVAAEGLEARVRWHAYVDDGRLVDLYARARAFAFLSEYEGLGLTPLEAMAAGVPPLVADTAVAHESCGDAALYAPPSDTAAIADAIERLLFDEATRAALAVAAPAVLARYDWPRAARETLRVIEDAAET